MFDQIAFADFIENYLDGEEEEDESSINEMMLFDPLISQHSSRCANG